MTFGAGAFGTSPFGGGDAPISNLGFELGTAGLAELWQMESSTQAEGLLPDYSDGSAVEDFEDGWVDGYAFDFAAALFSAPIVEDFELGWDNTGYLVESFGSEMLPLTGPAGPVLIESFAFGWIDGYLFAFDLEDDPYVYQLTNEGRWPNSFDSSLSGSFVDGDLSAPSLYGTRNLALEDFEFVKTPKTFTGNAADDKLVSTAHGLSANMRVVLLPPVGGTLPAPLAADVPYYVVSPTTDDFQVALTSGGAAIALTTAGTGFMRWHAPYEFWTSMMASL